MTRLDPINGNLPHIYTYEPRISEILDPPLQLMLGSRKQNIHMLLL